MCIGVCVMCECVWMYVDLCVDVGTLIFFEIARSSSFSSFFHSSILLVTCLPSTCSSSLSSRQIE